MMQKKIAELKIKLSNGVSPAMATPLHAGSSRVNIEVIPQLVEFLIDRGVKGLFVGGSTGEGILLRVSERKKLHESTLAAAHGRVPILLHVGGIRTEVTLDLAKHAADIGADAMVAVAPIFYGMHDDALAAYYVSIAEAAPDVPLFGYDVPHMAVNGIGGPLAIRLCAEIPSLAGIKSSNKDAQVVRRQIDALPADRIILVGSESIALGSMALGADGMISGLSTAVPEPFVAMLSAFASGNMIEARRMQKLINRLLACMPAGARIGGIKAILAERGIPVGSPVAPLPSPDREIWPPMRSILAR